ncbi:MAG: branched chain amino acid aminotransferase, partial [Gammaproteobacteria bacterium]
GDGRPGKITRRMQDLFFGLFDGRTPDKYGWLEPVG